MLSWPALSTHPLFLEIFGLVHRHHGLAHRGTHLLGLAIKTFIVLVVIAVVIVLLVLFLLVRLLRRGRRPRS